MSVLRHPVASARAKVRAIIGGPPPASACAAISPTPPPPPAPAPDEPVLGVCLSGGGSRALTGALGAISGLRSLPDPSDPDRTVMDRVRYLSSVSGGSWASVAYTFLPKEVGGKPIDDDDFLIAPVAPDELAKSGDDPRPGNVEYMNPRGLGTAPQQFAPLPIARVLYKYWRWGFFKNDKKWNWFWVAAIGELILKPYDLYDAKYPRGSNVTQPSHFFGESLDYFKRAIRDDNPDLSPDEFHFVVRDRPALVVNFNLLEDGRKVDPIQVPVQATPSVVGVLGESPDRTIVGGGSVQSFGFATTLDGRCDAAEPGSPAKVGLDRRYSLSDITACSSAFFAEQLLQFLDGGIDTVGDAIVDALRRFWVPRFIGRLIARFLCSRVEPIVNTSLSNLIPRYPYWPIGAVDEEPAPTTKPYGFSDGGSFEDTGVLGMLARTDANRIIAFVNGAAALSQDPATGKAVIDEQEIDPLTGEVRIDGQISTLFGYTYNKDSGDYEKYAESDPRRFAQVFHDEGDVFDELRDGLIAASTGGGADPLGTHTVALVQNLTTIENRVASIAAGREVTVLWVVNNRVNAWQDQITDQGIKDDLAAGQAGQHPDGSSIPGAKGSGPLENFPLYTTGPQVHLDKEAVNMMAQLSAWNVRQLSAEITALLDG